MSILEVSLPDDIKQFVESQATASGYASPGEYVAAVLRQLQKRRAWDQMEKQVLEGLASPASEMTSADWQELRDLIDSVESKSG